MPVGVVSGSQPGGNPQSFKELASEGERLCKAGDCVNGLRYFEAALAAHETSGTIDNTKKPTTDQLHTMQDLSVVYNQMGNAYFYLQEYKRALECHKHDLELCEQFGDDPGRAKACGNIGNALQLMGDYDDAILYLLRNLEISKSLSDVAGEARATYNLGNIYQAKGRHMARFTYNDSRDTDIVEFSHIIKEELLKAVQYYRQTLTLVVAYGDRAAEGRTYGNLGNTHYLLGDFDAAIDCHQRRLAIARECGDRAAERRAYANLGNALVFQGKHNEAADFYVKAMNVAIALGDKAVEAQSYYSLGNLYVLLKDHAVAINFYMRHLHLAQILHDQVGESRSYWSLGNAYAEEGDLEKAIDYANKHLQLARLIGDSSAELAAKMNLYDYQNLLGASSVRDAESGLFTPVNSKYGRKYFERSFNSQMRKSSSIDSFYSSSAVEQRTSSVATLPTMQQPTDNKHNMSSHSDGTQPLSYRQVFMVDVAPMPTSTKKSGRNASSHTLPVAFETRWMNGNFKYFNKFSDHDNYNNVQNYGEYLDTPYGRKFIVDKMHMSNEVFVPPHAHFAQREQNQAITNQLYELAGNKSTHRRFTRHHKAKVHFLALGEIRKKGDEMQTLDLDAYLRLKKETAPTNSLNMDCEMRQPVSLFSSVPFKAPTKPLANNWKYSYTQRNNQAYPESLRRVRTTCIDLSKY